MAEKMAEKTTIEMNEMKVLATKPTADYELLDSGEGEKLERFGAYILRRPDPQALWAKQLSAEKWDAADAHFVQSGRSGNWKKKIGATGSAGATMPDSWNIKLTDLTFSISLKNFKHTGLFPEQSGNWKWISETLSAASSTAGNTSGATTIADRPLSVLNLFGYTGGATLAAAASKTGVNVTHVDASKVSVAQASENAKLSGLENAPIRWIVDDALEFVKREARRGNKYDAIIMDPPTFGHGPNKEVWEIEKSLPQLISECKKILSDLPVFILMNGYAAGYSALAYKNNVADLLSDHISKGTIECGELALEAKNGRQLPAGIFARWRTAL